MSRIILLCLAAVLSLASSVVHAQERTVNGRVTSTDDGSALPGVNVVVKGTTSGAVTDADGRYSLVVPPGDAILVFTFIGLQTQEVNIGTRTIVDVQMATDVTQLSEVVVTALGIERDKASLGYATQQISGDNMRVAREQNVNAAIAGKIAGVQIVSGSGAKFGAPAIRIRGIRGISGASPLYVLDGIVIDDPASINMDNIQSINVLKGANAAALYGSRARDGVILLSSKKGTKSEQITIDVNHTTTFENVYILPEYQNEYGGGYSQEFDLFDYDPAIHDPALAGLDGLPMPYLGADESWGPKMDGRQVAQWDSFTPGTARYGQAYPWSPNPDNVRDYFRTGVMNNTGLSLGKSSEAYSLNATVSRSTRTGVLENTNQDKTFMNLYLTAKLSKKLSVEASANYSDSYTKGNLFEGYNSIGSNVNQWFQRQLDTETLKKYWKMPDGSYTSWNMNSPTDPTPLYWDNPYTYLYAAYSERERQVLSAKFGLTYEIVTGLKASVQGMRNSRSDLFYDYRDQNLKIGPALFATSEDLRQEDNIQGMLSYDKRFGDFSIVSNIGMNYRTNTRDIVSMSTSGGLNVRGLYNILNSRDPAIISNFTGESKVNSWFGQLSTGWRDMIFLDLTIREDYDSRLPLGRNNFTYPSASLSYVFTEMTNLPWLTFGKVRGSYANVGNELDWYQTIPTYGLGVAYNGNAVTSVPNNLVDPELRAATTESLEAGLELGFFDNRIHTEFSYYHQNNANEVLAISVPAASGGTSYLTNDIDSYTKGWELSIGGKPVKDLGGFNWDVNFNIARNIVFIRSLGDNLTSFPLANAFRGTSTLGGWDGQALARENEEWGIITGRRLRRDENGNVMVNAAGRPLTDANQDLGHILPRFTGGMFNRFSYKNFEFSFTIDYQVGGNFMSISRMFGAYSGLTSETVGLNDKGVPKRDDPAEGGGLTFGGVFADGTPNNIYLSADTYYKSLFGVSEQWIYDATFVKMRELRVGYNFPASMLENTKVLRGASIAFVANNPFLLHSNVEGIDPSEISGDQIEARNNGSWVESGNLPGTRTYGVDIRLKF